MKGSEGQEVKELENIIRALADVWPSDRGNVAVAGAQFEEFVEEFDEDIGQLQKLIDLAWKGLKHLYAKDEYFMSIKTATMQAVNTIREYMIKDGDIQVEEFEKACFNMEKSLSGRGESADTLLELDENAPVPNDNDNGGQANEQAEAVSLNDLASFIMALDEDAAAPGELKRLDSMLEQIIAGSEEHVSGPLEMAREMVKRLIDSDSSSPADWLPQISAQIEKAIESESDQTWEEAESVKGEESKAEGGSSGKDSSESEDGAEPELFYIPDDIDVTLIGEFITESTDLLEMAESALLDLEEMPDDDELINKVFRAFHTIKGTSAFMGLEPISEFTHLLETMLSMVREGDLRFDMACADISFESIDVIKQMLTVTETASGGDPLPRPDSYDPLIRVLSEIANENVGPAQALSKEQVNIGKQVAESDPVDTDTDEGSDGKQPEADPAGNGAANTGSKKAKAESSVRVNVGRLDRLIDMIGELVIAHSVVAQDSAIPSHYELQKKVNHTSKILRELQDTSLTLRMVPLDATFHKMNRLVRDVARKAGKKVSLTTYGGDTEIDRNMVDIINEPLVHMVRNAIDHGIEDPEERAKAGKMEKANVWLRASQEGGMVVIEIEDDGRGINKEKVLNKAIEKGLIEPDKKLTDKEIYNLIFLPGFSSADKVTDLSGRGVGMDVVRKSIEQLQGKIDVSSEEGKGTKISLELPFTLAITDGMLVGVGNERFIVPTINIDMAFRAEEKDIFTVFGKSEKISLRGQTVPVVRLHELFDIEDGTEDLTEGTFLIIRNSNKKYALLVDEVIDQQQLVGKSINMMVKTKYISGGAILGDGRVGLILDTASLTQ